MVKAYLRYEQAASFGVISSNSNLVYDADGKFVLASALENIIAWNIKTGSQVSAVGERRSRVSSAPIERHAWVSLPPQEQLLSPSLTSTSGAPASTAAPEVTALARAPMGRQLAAGYSDGSVRLWDLDSGDCSVTLAGHKVMAAAGGGSGSAHGGGWGAAGAEGAPPGATRPCEPPARAVLHVSRPLLQPASLNLLITPQIGRAHV